MSDEEILEVIARLWVEAGGDAEDVTRYAAQLKQAVERLTSTTPRNACEND